MRGDKDEKARKLREFRKWYLSLKTAKACTDCGNIFPPVCMQWDHLPQYDKLANVGDLYRRQDKRLVLAEIAKCELVCANCHAIRTAERLASRT